MAKNKIEPKAVSFTSPLDNPEYGGGERAELLNQVNAMLGGFANGLTNTQEGRNSLEYLRKSPHLDEIIKPLQDGGVLGDDGKSPSVKDMLKLGDRLYITGPDGSSYTYSSLFYQNDTVKELQKQEKAGAKDCGKIMAAHMSMFLSLSPNYQLLNMSGAFMDLGPNVSRGTAKITLNMPNAQPVAVVDKQSLSKYNDLQKQYQEKEKEYKQYIERDVPPKPREKNFFRRILCGLGFRHTEAYNKKLAARNHVIEQNNLRKQKRQELEAIRAQLDRTPEAVEVNAAIESTKKVAEDYLKLPKAVDPQKALFNTENVEKIMKADMMTLKPRMVSTMLDVIKNRAAIEADMKANPLAPVETGNNVIDQLDTTPYNDVAKLYSLDNKAMASATLAQSLFESKTSEHGGRTVRGVATEKFYKAAANDYNRQVECSKQCFQQVFGMEATPENVQEVVDKVGLDQYVKQGVEKLDGEVYNPAEDKIPPVNESNCGDITLLLMSGLKTVAMTATHSQNGREMDAASMNKTKTHDAAEKESQAITNYKPKDEPTLALY